MRNGRRKYSQVWLIHVYIDTYILVSPCLPVYLYRSLLTHRSHFTLNRSLLTHGLTQYTCTPIPWSNPVYLYTIPLYYLNTLYPDLNTLYHPSILYLYTIP